MLCLVAPLFLSSGRVARVVRVSAMGVCVGSSALILFAFLVSRAPWLVVVVKAVCVFAHVAMGAACQNLFTQAHVFTILAR